MAVDLWAYGDESGIEGSGPFCVVAGFIGTPRHWDSFKPAWRKVIDHAGIDEFHAKLFFDRRKAAKQGEKNPFRHWTTEKALAFLDDLLAVLKRHSRIKPIGCSLNVNDFMAFTWGERQYLTGGMWDREKSRFVTSGAPTRIYHLPVHGFIGDALTHARPDDCKVHFVLDEQRVMQQGVLQTIAEVRAAGLFDLPIHQKMGGITFDDSKNHEGIQAADLLAHLWFSNYLRRDRLDTERRHALTSILGLRWRMGVMTAAKLEALLAKNLTPEGREQIKAVKSPAEIQRVRRSQKSAG